MISRARISLLATFLVHVGLLAGCAESGSPILRSASLAHPRAAEIWSEKCGSCHVPVEPGTRPRGLIESAMNRHQKRTKLTTEEWQELVEFLTVSPSRTASREP